MITRIQKVAKHLKPHQILFVSDSVDLQYLLGEQISRGSLCIEPEKAYLFVDGRYREAFLGRKDLVLGDDCEVYLKKAGLVEIVTDFSRMTHQEFVQLSESVPSCKWIDQNIVTKVRAIKEPSEIEALKKSSDLNQKAMAHIMPLIKAGVKEKDIAVEYEWFGRKGGASSVGFVPIICFGEGGALPHHRAGNRVLQENEAVVVDVGLVVDGYGSDRTKSFFYGEAPPEYLRLEKLVGEAYHLAFAHAKPGETMKNLHTMVQAFFKENGVDHLFIHGLGHGIGLEVHEIPYVRTQNCPFEVGMTIALEPGLYVEGKFGIRYERTMIIEKDGAHEF